MTQMFDETGAMLPENQGKTITLQVTVAYPGSVVSDLVFDGSKFSATNKALQAAVEAPSQLHTLVEAVKTAKAEYQRLRWKQAENCDRTLRDEFDEKLLNQTNIVYNAVQAFAKYWYKETGVITSDASDLFSSFGYVCGEDLAVQPIHGYDQD